MATRSCCLTFPAADITGHAPWWPDFALNEIAALRQAWPRTAGSVHGGRWIAISGEAARRAERRDAGR